MSYPKYALCGALALSLLGAGCSSSTTATSSVSTGAPSYGGSPSAPAPAVPTPIPAPVVVAPSACTIFTQADAEALFGGVTVKQDAVIQTDPSTSQCTFSVGATNLGGGQRANVLVHAYATVGIAMDYMVHAKQALVAANLSPQAVAGVGDDAMWSTGILNQLVVRSGDKVVVLSVSSAVIAKESPTDQLNTSIKTMRTVLSRLP